jgi:hypothetical protein
MKKFSLLLVVFALCLGTSAFAQEEALQDPGFDNPAEWTFAQFNSGGSGSVSGSQASITHPGGGGQGGILYDEIPTGGSASLVDGNAYDVNVDRNFAALGPSAVAELWVGGDPSAYGGGDYPGSTPDGGANILKDDCWGGGGCGATGGFAPMPQGPGVGNPWTYTASAWTGGQVWYVLKVSGWGPGSAQTVDFDNASVWGTLDVSDWMLY